GGSAVVGAETLRLVGRGGGAVDGARSAGLPGGQAPRPPRRHRRRWPRRARGRCAVRPQTRRPRVALLPLRDEGRPTPDALRTVGDARPEPPPPRTAAEPRGEAV